MTSRYFTHETFAFLSALAANNNREWFEQNKQAYEAAVRTPALAFITDLATELAMISPCFLALPRKVGGSLMRIHRDTRFGKDKRPYKTNIGIQFRHEVGKDVHAPGYYVHIEPGGCFIGVGVWRPDAAALGKIRGSIIAKSNAWLTARDDKTFRKYFTLDGEVLANPPRGYAKDHPLIEDLKRKDFIAIAKIGGKSVTSDNFNSTVTEHFEQATPYMCFLCKALELSF
ncbi:MAG: DUF2461 domain-containing protein [Gammaproteobacteria bacterium]|nr:DUF2461 domain-containing protein [Gammaproteobacteria bacterium]